MVKVEKTNGEMFVCNSCMKENPYKIQANTNEYNGCAIYLCQDCMERVIGQFSILQSQNTMTEEQIEFEWELWFGKNGILNKGDRK